MRIAHLADLHLGYRAYHRLTPDGANQRERDVAEAAARVVDQVVDAAPDLVVVAGDVFHAARPSNTAIMDGFRLFTRLRAGLPRTPVVVVAGDTDAPQPDPAGSLLRLLAEIPGVSVVDDEARAVRLDDPDVSVLCVPHVALAAGDSAPLEPDPDAAVNVLVAHGTLAGTGVEAQLAAMGDHGGGVIEAGAVDPARWDYVALGHYHNPTRIERNVWYAGAPERTSPDVWAEAETRKGWVLFDTVAGAGGTASFHEVETRELVDLPGFSAASLDAAAVDRRIGEAVAALPGRAEGKVIRLVIQDLSRELFRRLDHEQVRRLKADAVHFQLEARRPPPAEPAGPDPGSARPTMEDELRRFLEAWEPTTAGIDRDQLVALGVEYLRRGPP